MKWFFQPDGDRTGARQDGEEDSGSGQISLSPELLERHGGRVLEPRSAVAVDGYPRPGRRCTGPGRCLSPTICKATAAS